MARPDVLQLHTCHLCWQHVLPWEQAPEHHALQLRERPCTEHPLHTMLSNRRMSAQCVRCTICKVTTTHAMQAVAIMCQPQQQGKQQRPEFVSASAPTGARTINAANCRYSRTSSFHQSEIVMLARHAARACLRKARSTLLLRLSRSRWHSATVKQPLPASASPCPEQKTRATARCSPVPQPHPAAHKANAVMGHQLVLLSVLVSVLVTCSACRTPLPALPCWGATLQLRNEADGTACEHEETSSTGGHLPQVIHKHEMAPGRIMLIKLEGHSDSRVEISAERQTDNLLQQFAVA